MRKYVFFLKCSSVVVKIAAWIFLCLGILGGGSLLFGVVSGNHRWVGLIILGVYAFLFFLLFLIAKIADLLVEIISVSDGNEIKKE